LANPNHRHGELEPSLFPKIDVVAAAGATSGFAQPGKLKPAMASKETSRGADNIAGLLSVRLV
jgi:hypothetical protein